MELTDAQLAALLRQTDEAWVESTNTDRQTPNIDAVLDATEGIVAEVRALRARIAAVDEIHKPHDCGCINAGLCDACDSLTWPCPTHTALHTSEENT